MGNFQIDRIETTEQRNRFYRHILNDLEAFDSMLLTNVIEKRNDRIGAEQELCIVDSHGQPLTRAREILKGVNDPHFTHELALHNLEINLDPVLLAPDGLERMEFALLRFMEHGSKIAADNQALLFLGGILPTIQARHLRFENMTPIERFRTINDLLLEMRGSDFEIYLQGVDDFNVTLESDLFEACNTSFQCHLQVDPDEFVQQYNWAQMIAGPVLSCATNSPLLFGRELWSETRIAVFKQSLDTRGFQNFTRINLPRVHFGVDWVKESPIEIWRQGVSRFPLLFHTEELDDAKDMLSRGQMPNLRALQLHNGTTYAWNRLCYGVKENIAHIRLECRYIPSGPTMIDQMANLAFWVGLMTCQPDDSDRFWERIDFRVAKDNFIRAARTGIHSVFSWFGERIAAQELLLEKLLPLASSGLSGAGVSNDLIEKYLGVIEARVRNAQTGSEWLVSNSRNLRSKFKPALINNLLVQESLKNQKANLPVHKWPSIVAPKPPFEALRLVEHLMNSDITTIKEEASIGLARKMMEWLRIHHLPVEAEARKIVGLLSWYELGSHSADMPIKNVMHPNIYTIEPTESLENARALMDRLNQNALLVMEEDRLVGIITSTDLEP